MLIALGIWEIFADKRKLFVLDENPLTQKTKGGTGTGGLPPYLAKRGTFRRRYLALRGNGTFFTIALSYIVLLVKSNDIFFTIALYCIVLVQCIVMTQYLP